jgi:NADH:ubiquinone reductase (non-electrogenic)
MKEVEDGIKVQKQILERLEAANAILLSRKLANRIIDEQDNKEIDKLLHWIIIGGGPTGVELVAELSDFVKSDVAKYFPLLSERVKITLLEATDKILGVFDSRLSAYAHTQLESRGAEVLCGAMVTKITKDYVEIKQKEKDPANSVKTNLTQIPYGSIVWAGGIATRPITKAIAGTIGKD